MARSSILLPQALQLYVQLLQIREPSPSKRRFASESRRVPQVLHRKQFRCHRFPAVFWSAPGSVAMVKRGERCGTKNEAAEKQAKFSKEKQEGEASRARSFVLSSVCQIEQWRTQGCKMRERQGASNPAAHIPSSKALPSSRIWFAVQEESAMFRPDTC